MKASAIAVMLVLATGTPASASLDDYLSNPGRQQAVEVGAQCGSGASSGAFQYYGPEDAPLGPAQGYQTGLNNSGVCGNR